MGGFYFVWQQILPSVARCTSQVLCFSSEQSIGEENVRIGSLREMFSVFDRVQDKEDKGGSNPEKQNPQFQQKENKNAQGIQVSDAEVQTAIEVFSQDETVQAQGLKASLIQSGPFLKVVLKDGSGALVRQFTGEEFLKLRDAVKKEGKTRGKILDQKL